MTLAIGTHVRVKDTYLDEALQTPLVGTVKDILEYDGARRFVVMFDHDDQSFPPGGEFSADRLAFAD
jgi:hypothetical protein